VLAARFGASVVGVDIPILLENICLEAKARDKDVEFGSPAWRACTDLLLRPACR